MTHSTYAHIVVYALITIIVVGGMWALTMVYRYINAMYIVPMLERMHARMMHQRSMDSTRAHYIRNGGK